MEFLAPGLNDLAEASLDVTAAVAETKAKHMLAGVAGAVSRKISIVFTVYDALVMVDCISTCDENGCDVKPNEPPDFSNGLNAL